MVSRSPTARYTVDRAAPVASTSSGIVNSVSCASTSTRRIVSAASMRKMSVSPLGLTSIQTRGCFCVSDTVRNCATRHTYLVPDSGSGRPCRQALRRHPPSWVPTHVGPSGTSTDSTNGVVRPAADSPTPSFLVERGQPRRSALVRRTSASVGSVRRRGSDNRSNAPQEPTPDHEVTGTARQRQRPDSTRNHHRQRAPALHTADWAVGVRRGDRRRPPLCRGHSVSVVRLGCDRPGRLRADPGLSSNALRARFVCRDPDWWLCRLWGVVLGLPTRPCGLVHRVSRRARQPRHALGPARPLTH